MELTFNSNVDPYFRADANLVLTAEGIETEQQSGLLRKMGCDAGQGFLFARPARPEQLSALLEAPADWRQVA